MHLLSTLRQRQCQQLIIIAAAGVLLLLFYHLYGKVTIDDARLHAATVQGGVPNRPLFDDLHLDEKQCRTTFPGLTKDIDDMVALGPFRIAPKPADADSGPLQVRLQNGRMYIVHHEGKGTLDRGFLDARMAALHQFHRAILTAPKTDPPFPDAVFAINVLDGPTNDTLSYSRPAYAASTPGNPLVTRAFLMPHFSFWGWPALSFVGSFAQATAAVESLERELPFHRKDPRPVWRGTKRYNSAQHPQMRTNLLKVAGKASWADVEELAWADKGGGDKGNSKTSSPVSTNALRIEDFCRYKYTLHTEGITYSGRLQFLQLCESVLLTPPMAWLQHTTHLVRPLFSSDLLYDKTGAPSWVASDGVQSAWPVHYSAAEANAVFVAPDWSDLEATVAWLERHPDVAQGIAQRQRALFVGGGYFSPAAEACYWRALIRGWSRVAKSDGPAWLGEPRGLPWEQFAMGYESGFSSVS
ncbi:hypothetical protein HMPREF1624_07738 [Sporothrix schenckii ATCC 58251]|uniref:Glycosyl transferase CAP10 domain-containing protein n=1 Tax=Sporothrix schenckii (strain ATCC 58251 / de Perez 2211183) TaxID=1391915 RepID=U7PLP4_SPOS1|nr:hypothetical protein HMPREF1624_07738 [Sporothrix schenckii ATCC 58251]